MTYFANGSEGDYLTHQCSKCVIGIDNYCPIAFIQHEYNYKQICSEGRFKGYTAPLIDGIMQILIRDGECTLKKCIEDAPIDNWAELLKRMEHKKLKPERTIIQATIMELEKHIE